MRWRLLFLAVEVLTDVVEVAIPGTHVCAGLLLLDRWSISPVCFCPSPCFCLGHQGPTPLGRTLCLVVFV